MTRPKDFKKLQAKWYKRLKDEGFEDIEWNDPDVEKSQNSRFLLGFQRVKNPNESVISTQNWFRLCRFYVTNATFASKIDRYLFEMYSEGSTYRSILANYRAKHPKRDPISLFKVFHIIERYKKDVINWNRTDPKGALYETSEDLYLEDVMISEHESYTDD